MNDDQNTSKNTARSREDQEREFEVLQTVIAALQALPAEARPRIFHSAGTFLEILPQQQRGAYPERTPTASVGSPTPTHPGFSEDRTMSPKEFLLEKQPRSDVERIACLAYYLTHYRDTNHFKTLDLSKLNTEAAQPKFSNAAYSTNNAVKQGYLVPATKGQRQLSAAGEQFVQALPDRDAAKAAMSNARQKRTKRRPKRSSSKSG